MGVSLKIISATMFVSFLGILIFRAFLHLQRLSSVSQENVVEVPRAPLTSRNNETVQNILGNRGKLEQHFYEIALSHKPVTDKVTVHAYETMYGMFLVPLKYARHQPKLLEIGLGCNMEYGPGASVQIWKDLLPGAEIWEAEYWEDCVESARTNGQLDGIQVVTGDQGDPAVLKKWKKKLGGTFDVIIDDGGHKNTQIGRSFDALWPLVRFGGVYIIEDLQVSRNQEYEDTNGQAIMADKIKAWIEALLTPGSNESSEFPIPNHVAFVFCQLEACVIGKRHSRKQGTPEHVVHDFEPPALRVRRRF